MSDQARSRYDAFDILLGMGGIPLVPRSLNWIKKSRVFMRRLSAIRCLPPRGLARICEVGILQVNACLDAFFLLDVLHYRPTYALSRTVGAVLVLVLKTTPWSISKHHCGDYNFDTICSLWCGP